MMFCSYISGEVPRKKKKYAFDSKDNLVRVNSRQIKPKSKANLGVWKQHHGNMTGTINAGDKTVDTFSELKQKKRELQEAKKVIKLMEKAENKEMSELRQRNKFLQVALNILQKKWQDYIDDYIKWEKTGKHE